METLKISFFGPFTLSLGEKAVREDGERSHKQWRLIKYMILGRDRAIGRRELIDATFGYGAYSGSPALALNALNAMLHRARATLAEVGLDPHKVIVFEKNAYRFILPENSEIDCELFGKYADKVFSGENLDVMKPHALSALEIYRGFFLDRSALDEKTRILAEKYHDTYKRIFTIACGALRRDGDFKKINDLCERACAIDPLCEDFYIERVRSLLDCGQSRRAGEIYVEASRLFESRPEIIPSQRFRDLAGELGADSFVRVILPEKYSAKAERLRELIKNELDGEDVKILLI